MGFKIRQETEASGSSTPPMTAATIGIDFVFCGGKMIACAASKDSNVLHSQSSSFTVVLRFVVKGSAKF